MFDECVVLFVSVIEHYTVGNSGVANYSKPITSLESAPPVNNGKAVQPSDGDFKCHALLKGVLRDGSVHLRPLCTSSDVVIALYELLDANIFQSGVVQLPHVLNSIFRRHTDGFYRYTHKLNRPGEWQYLK